MSIVLDALRKAEAERARGEVPGLHSAIGPAAVPLPASPTSNVPWQGVALGAGALLALVGLVIGAGAWWRWVQADVATPEVARSTANTANTAATAATAAQPAPALVLTPRPAPAQAASPAITRAAPVPVAVTPAASAARPVTPTPAATPAAPVPSQAAAPASVVPVPSSATPPADGKPVPLADLPDEIRRDLPPLSVGGLIQMDDPPRRSLIINGAIVMEGEAVQPGLLLERIGSGQATLRYKGWRFLLGI